MNAKWEKREERKAKKKTELDKIFLFDVTLMQHLLVRGYEPKTNWTESNRMAQEKKRRDKKEWATRAKTTYGHIVECL